MIQLNPTHISTPQPDVRIKIVGLGGAGSNALDRIMLDGVPGAELVAINTDVQALTGSVVPEKVQLGRATTRGLGAGGDPEVGYAAAEEGIDEIRAALDGAQMIFLCTGLGGGTGSGAARIVASLAREHNALVVAFATLPFSFEGKRRMAQAEEALGALQRSADVVICFENDKMSEAVSPLAGIHEAFAVADQTISQSVRAIAGLVHQRGLVHIGFDELTTALRSTRDGGPRCLFGYGEADGDNRANEALARALKSPLMHKGRMLDGVHNVLVNVAGGPGMTLNEVQILMEELNRHIGDQTRILFGTAVDPQLGQKMAVTILGALQTEESAVAPAPMRPSSPRAETLAAAAGNHTGTTSMRAAERSTAEPGSPPAEQAPKPLAGEPTSASSAPEAAAIRPAAPVPEPPPLRVAREVQPTPSQPARESVKSRWLRAVGVEPAAQQKEPAANSQKPAAPAEAAESVPSRVAAAPSAPAPPAPAAPARTAAVAAGEPKPKTPAKQEQMQFEPATRGRFEKSEPTIVDGQDLDVPTFLRRNVKVK